MNCPFPPFDSIMRHMAAVPKGFLKHYVLVLLNEKPMSGSEIMSEIEEQSNSRWTPSPGSIYPLLAWLQDQGYTGEIPNQEPGIKRYRLTIKGKEFYEEYVKKRKELQKRTEFFWSHPFRRLWFNLHEKGVKELFKARKQLTRSIMSIWNTIEDLDDKHSEETINKVTKVLEDSAKKIDEIAQKRHIKMQTRKTMKKED